MVECIAAGSTGVDAIIFSGSCMKSCAGGGGCGCAILISFPSQPEVYPAREEPSSRVGSNLRFVQVDAAQVLNCRSAVMVDHSRHQSCIALHSSRGKCQVHGELAAFLMFAIFRDVRLTLQAQVCPFLKHSQAFIQEFHLLSNPSNSI